jgi:hypothetical protein
MAMYCKEMIKIGKASNGYIVEVCCPIKQDKKGPMGMMGGGEGEAQFVAKDAKECCAKIAELLPKLDDTYTTEKAFADAFGAAVAEDDTESED